MDSLFRFCYLQEFHSGFCDRICQGVLDLSLRLEGNFNIQRRTVLDHGHIMEPDTFVGLEVVELRICQALGYFDLSLATNIIKDHRITVLKATDWMTR